MKEIENYEESLSSLEALFSITGDEAINMIEDKIDLKDIDITDEAAKTLGKCASLFILYITDAALEYCEDDERNAICTSDILNALEDTDFSEIHDALVEDLHNNEEHISADNYENAENSQDLSCTNSTGNNQDSKEDKPNDDFDIFMQALK
ncbi:CCAAT-binding transcription factor, putative [Plasmodium ovale curtisi]|uniref:CCAAT-binding transcription factor, putative n=1 Tax=Plasmodium ovale curtisi TaxID=864141 RepID=A0A1A8WK92_PLAOA|nr:CCAAT-binding transcription factor, putative [Plasmodium ovale curtisi]SBS99206.1 CCAAT-binding transcription factor, putative [Plasmodium ovale curtisi]